MMQYEGRLTLRHFHFKENENGERSRKASLHAFVPTKALHLKPKVFFTSSPIPEALLVKTLPAPFHYAAASRFSRL